MMKKAQQIRTMFPMGLSDDIRVSTTSLRPGARLITLQEEQKKCAVEPTQGSCHQTESPALQRPHPLPAPGPFPPQLCPTLWLHPNQP